MKFLVLVAMIDIGNTGSFCSFEHLPDSACVCMFQGRNTLLSHLDVLALWFLRVHYESSRNG